MQFRLRALSTPRDRLPANEDRAHNDVCQKGTRQPGAMTRLDRPLSAVPLHGRRRLALSRRLGVLPCRAGCVSGPGLVWKDKAMPPTERSSNDRLCRDCSAFFTLKPAGAIMIPIRNTHVGRESLSAVGTSCLGFPIGNTILAPSRTANTGPRRLTIRKCFATSGLRRSAPFIRRLEHAPGRSSIFPFGKTKG